MWKHFDQVADIDSGFSRLICQVCLTVLDHTQYKENGTSTMSRYKNLIPVVKETRRNLISH